MRYVYLLALTNAQIHTGKTEDLRRRVEEHTAGKVVSTRGRRPVVLLGYEAYRVSTDADRREKFLKTTEGKRLLRQQYRDVLAKLMR